MTTLSVCGMSLPRFFPNKRTFGIFSEPKLIRGGGSESF